MSDTLAWLNEHYRMTQIPQIGDAANELSRLRKIAAAARLVSEMSSYDEDEGEVSPCHMVYFEELEAALQALPKGDKSHE